MPPDLTFDLTAMAATAALASRVAGLARAGDTIALSGPLGSGKTTFARHFLAARGVSGEVPSPTFSLVQVYGGDEAEPAVWHFDLYRVEDESEVLELGLEEALADAIVLIEWPERLRRLMPADRLDVALSMADQGPGRTARLAVHGGWRDRRGLLAGAVAPPAAGRSAALDRFLGLHGWSGARREALAGDASFRRYERVHEARGEDAATAIVMDAPPEHEDLHPFRAVAAVLEGYGYSPPRILAADAEAGFLLLEDLGDDLFRRVLESGGEALETELYAAAVDLLADLHGRPAPQGIEVPGAAPYALPAYSDGLLMAEAALFTDWYLPALRGSQATPRERAEFSGLWRAALDAVAASPPVLVLRDYHADNLLWLPERRGHGRVGLLDFQDAVAGHPAYDLVSLLEDARRDVAPTLAGDMIARYCRAAAGRGAGFDETAFRLAYGVLGAQRNTKIIGIFARLWKRDSKPAYRGLIPRVWALLERDLEAPALAPLRDWFGRAVPVAARGRAPGADS